MKHPVDAHVGKRIRHRRWMVGMTQQQLADKAGVKFQQIQKYETGANRVSASRLWDIAEAMDVSVAFFFEGLNGKNPESTVGESNKKAAMLAGRIATLTPNQQVALGAFLDAFDQHNELVGKT
jgi:transcriptional regulator with XRE-family HTH domain